MTHCHPSMHAAGTMAAGRAQQDNGHGASAAEGQ